MPYVEKIKGIILDESDLVVSIFLLVFAILVNVIAYLWEEILPFPQSVYISLSVISLALLSYLIFQVRNEMFGDSDLDDGEEIAADFLSSILYELRSGVEPSQERIKSLLSGTNDLLIHGHDQAYSYATEVANSASEQVVLLQHSLILILGPRGYLNHPKDPLESEQYTTFQRIVERSRDGEVEVDLAYLIEGTASEMETVSDKPQYSSYRRAVAERLYLLCTYSNMSNSKFRLLVPGTHQTPLYHFVAGDDTFGIWFKNLAKENEALCITSDNGKATNIFKRLFRSTFEEVEDYETAAEQLGLEDIDINKEELKGKRLDDISLH